AQRGKSFGPKAQRVAQRRRAPGVAGSALERRPHLILTCFVFLRTAQRAKSSPCRVPSRSTNGTPGILDQLLAVGHVAARYPCTVFNPLLRSLSRPPRQYLRFWGNTP